MEYSQRFAPITAGQRARFGRLGVAKIDKPIRDVAPRTCRPRRTPERRPHLATHPGHDPDSICRLPGTRFADHPSWSRAAAPGAEPHHGAADGDPGRAV